MIIRVAFSLLFSNLFVEETKGRAGSLSSYSVVEIVLHLGIFCSVSLQTDGDFLFPGIRYHDRSFVDCKRWFGVNLSLSMLVFPGFWHVM